MSQGTVTHLAPPLLINVQPSPATRAHSVSRWSQDERSDYRSESAQSRSDVPWRASAPVPSCRPDGCGERFTGARRAPKPSLHASLPGRPGLIRARRSGSGWRTDVDDTRDAFARPRRVVERDATVAGDITLLPDDPRLSNPDLVDRDWGTRLRNFGTTGEGSEIYVGAGDLSFAGNRKVADMLWANTPVGTNTFTFAFTPSPARFTVTAAGTTTASQFYDFQTPIANPNQLFNALLIHLETKGQDEVIITNLVLTITGGATTNLGTIRVTQGQNIYGLISDIAGAHTSGFTLTGNIVYPAGFEGSQEDKPGIEFFALFDRSQAAQADLTLAKSHTGDFVQGQIGATYTLTASNIGPGPTTGRSGSWTTSLRR